jgi:hypothetical protein
MIIRGGEVTATTEIKTERERAEVTRRIEGMTQATIDETKIATGMRRQNGKITGTGIVGTATETTDEEETTAITTKTGIEKAIEIEVVGDTITNDNLQIFIAYSFVH